MTTANTNEDKLILGGHEFTSRFILGSGKFSLDLVKACIEKAGTQIITLALRRANQGGLANILDYIPKNITLLPNTSGARNAEEAVRIARLSRELGCGDFVKIEVIHDSKYLLPDNYETIKATEILAKEGFVVMPYMYPDLNAARMADSAARLEMPVFPEDRFVDAIKQVVKANAAYVPPYGSGATLYVRPYMFGSSAVIGVKPAEEYQFRVFATPVGPYFKGGAKPITIKVSDFDRAAPHGTGHVKAGLNYAMSLHAIVTAHEEGYDENMYLDAATRTKVEETGGANFIFVTKDNKVVTPKSSTILPSITRRSLMYVAEHYLGLEVEEREVYLDELGDFAECGLCGTAAVISPVGKIVDHGKEICFPSGMEEMGPVTKKLYETLTGIQMGHIEAPEGWICKIC